MLIQQVLSIQALFIDYILENFSFVYYIVEKSLYSSYKLRNLLP